MNAAQSAYTDHLASDDFRLGITERLWRLPGESQLVWPFSLIAVATNPAFHPPGWIDLRFDLENYPGTAPTAICWDTAKGQPLHETEWPKGPGNVSAVFRKSWVGLYAPCDRSAIAHHPQDWQSQYPNLFWRPTHTIVNYLNFLITVLKPYRENI